jgi:hypothetical protein
MFSTPRDRGGKGRSLVSEPNDADWCLASVDYFIRNSSRPLARSSSLHYTHHGTVYCSTFALNYALALYCVSESTKSCTVAG